MTSEERKITRRIRREAKRAKKRFRSTAKADSYADVFSYRNVYLSYRKCILGVTWKNSVQEYALKGPLEVKRTVNKLMRNEYTSEGFYEFFLRERGHLRWIRAVGISERVIHYCLYKNSLIPMLSRTLIYDNGAGLSGKGYHFAMSRLEAHLQKYYRKHRNEGYILLYDFSKFFDNISHKKCLEILSAHYSDGRLLQLLKYFISIYGEKGLGLGSPISLILALAVASPLDHYCKEVLRIRYYGRYNDDGYMIHQDKKYLEYCLEQLNVLCEKCGIVLNLKKTRIVKLSHGFTYLKSRIFLTGTGKVVKKIYPRSVKVQRRKLKSMYKMYKAGQIGLKDILSSYSSWRAYAANFNAYGTISSMDALFHDLFQETIYDSFT